MTTQRLFVALPVVPSFIKTFEALPRTGFNGRWTHGDDLHITIRFLGDVAEFRVPDIVAALRRVRRPAFHLDIRGLDVFHQDKQDVLYAKVEGMRKLMTLCADITDVLQPLHFDFGMRPYHPHVTLARLSPTKALGPYIKKYERQVNAHWQVADFALMRSAHPDEKGRHYDIIETFPLK